MSFKNFGGWLLTERGRQTCFGLSCLAGITTLSVKYLPNTFFLDTYKDVIRLYKLNIEYYFKLVEENCAIIIFLGMACPYQFQKK